MSLEYLPLRVKGKIQQLMLLYQEKSGKIPLDMEILISLTEEMVKKNIVVFFRDYKHCRPAGVCIPHIDKFSIFVNQKCHLYWQRFVLCHEIAHVILNFESNKNEIKRHWAVLGTDDNDERGCDDIATHILCPPWEMENLLHKFKYFPQQLELFVKKQKSFSEARLEIMADIFEIPLEFLIKYIKNNFAPLIATA